MMIKDYNVHIPPHLSDVLADLGHVSENADFDTIINAGRPALFNFSYPVSAADKQPLEEFILNYYITRRISSGNVKKWRQYLKGKMLEIMPYYKQLLDSEKLEFEPLLNNDILTTDDYAGTLDQTNDKRTDNDDEYSKEGSEHGEFTRDEVDTDAQTVRSVTESSYTKDETDTDNQTKNSTTEGSYTKDETDTDNQTKNSTTEGSYTKDETDTENATKAITESGNYSKSGSENTNTTEVNRYSDTPQGDSSRIWELDAQGNPVLTNIFLTDIRGITTSGSRTWNESGTDGKTTNETDTGTKVIDEEGTNESETNETLQDTKVIDEEGTSESETNETLQDTKVIDEEGTSESETNDTISDRKVFDEEGTNDRTWTESGTDNRDIVEHETIDQDTTHTNTNLHLGVSNQSKSSLLMEYRETFLRIYGMIAEELQPLFYNLVEIDDILDYVY